MKKLLFSCMCLVAFGSASADITPVLTPASGQTVTDLSAVKVTFQGLEVLTTPKLENISATLKNETTGDEYVCVAFDKSSWRDEFAWVSLKFGAEGTTTPLEITAAGEYSLSIAAGSFKSEITDPTYYSPQIDATYTIAGATPGAPTVTYGDNYTTGLWGTMPEAETNKIEVETGTSFKLTAPDAQQIKFSGKNTTTGQTFEGSGLFQGDSHEWTVSDPGLYCFTIAIVGKDNSVTGGYLYVEAKDAATTMDNYTLTPAAGSSVAEIANVKVTFPDTGFWGPKVVDISGITLTGSDGTVYTVMKAVPGYLDPDMTLTFGYDGTKHPMTIVNPGTYTLNIPAGAFCNLGNKDHFNKEITAEIIVTGKSSALPFPTLTPASGKVSQIYGIKLAYDSSVSSLSTEGEAWKDIALTVYLPAGELITKCSAVTIDGSEATLYFGKEIGEKIALRTADTYVLSIPEGAFSGIYGGGKKTSGALTACYDLVPRTGSNDLLKVEFPGETIGAGNMVWAESVTSIEMRFPDAEYGLAPLDAAKISEITLVYTPSAYAISQGENAAPVTYHPASVNLEGTDGAVLTFDNSNGQMNKFGKYLLTVPAGTFEETDNANSKNREITRTYRVAAEDEIGLRMYYNEDGTGEAVTLYKTEAEAASNVLKIKSDTTLWLFLEDASRLSYYDDATGESEYRNGSRIPVTVARGEHRYEFTGVLGYESYIAYLNVKAKDVLYTMDNYSLTPADGSSVAEIANVKVTFPDTGFWGPKVVNLSDITLTGSDGSVYTVKKAVPGALDPDITLTFGYEATDHPMTIVNPGTYTLNIPAGAFCNLGDPEDLNKDITAEIIVTGNADALPFPTLTPASGEEVEQIYGIKLAYDSSVASLTTEGEAWKDIALTVYLPAGESVTKCSAVTITGSEATLYFGKEIGEKLALRTADTYVLSIPEGAFSGVYGGGKKMSGALTACYNLVPRTASDDLLKVEFPGETIGAGNMVWTESMASVGMRFPDAVYGLAALDASKISQITLVYTPSAYAVSQGENAAPVTYHPAGAAPKDADGVELFFPNADGQMEKLGKYLLTVPAGTFEEADNANSKNSEITRTYRVTSDEEKGLRMNYSEDGTGDAVTLYATAAEAAANELVVDENTTLWLFLDDAESLSWKDEVTGAEESGDSGVMPVVVTEGKHRYVFSGEAYGETYVRYLDVTGKKETSVKGIAYGDVRISVEGGRLTVEGAENVAIYSIEGTLISTDADAILAPGIYIVSADGMAQKIIVR